MKTVNRLQRIVKVGNQLNKVYNKKGLNFDDL